MDVSIIVVECPSALGVPIQPPTESPQLCEYGATLPMLKKEKCNRS